MINKILNYGLGAVVIFLLTMYLTTCSQKKELENKIIEKEAESERVTDFYLAWIDSIRQAKIVVDSLVYVDRWHPGETIKIPQAVDSILVAEIINEKGNQPLYIKNYRGEKVFEDLTLNYHIKTYGELIGFNIESFMVKEEHHYNTAVVTKPPKPTMEVLKKRSHLYLMFGLNARFAPGLSGVSTGLNFISKNGWGLGVRYMRVDKLNIYEANVHLKIL